MEIGNVIVLHILIPVVKNVNILEKLKQNSYEITNI